MSNQVGVFVSRATAGPLAFGPDPGDSLFIGLVAERGLANVPTLITSFDRFKQVFGGATPFAAVTRYSSGYEVLKAYFSKGKTNKRAYVVRIIGTAVAAYVTLLDRHAVTPAATIRVTAKGEGTWGNAYGVIVADGTKTNTFKLTITDGDDATVETWDNLAMTDASLEAVNSGSDYIQLLNLDSATASPLNRPAAGTFDLNDTTAGTDDNAVLAAEIVGTEAAGVKTGLMAFRDAKYGRGFVIAPDLDTDATVRAELMAHYAYYRLFLTSVPEAQTPAQAITDLATGSIQDWNVLYYYPRGYVEDELTEEYKTIPLVGHVVADWLSAIADQGAGKAPAGRDFKADRIVKLETQANGMPLIDAAVSELLIASGVNPIWDRNGQGARVWGARTTSTDAAWQYAHAAYLWCVIASRVQSTLDELVYDVADPMFFQSIRLGIRAFLCSLHNQGAFNGSIPNENAEVDPTVHAFDVQCDESMLSATDKANGIVRSKIWFRPALCAETILVEVAKMNQT